MSSATYIPNVGVVLAIQGASEGLSVVIPDTMTIAAAENHIRELQAWLA